MTIPRIPAFFKISIILVLAFVFIISPKGLFAEEKEHMSPSLLPVNSSWVDSVMSELSLEEKIGQLFMVSAYSNRGPGHTQHILRLIKKHKIGGLIFFQGTPGKQAKLTNIYQHNSEVPLMVAMDAEWGLGMRLDSTINYPRQMNLGAISDDSLIYKMGLDIGEQLRRLGVHINFAPVVDVNNNPDNPVIGSRSFGEDRYNVAQKGIAYMNGLQDKRVMAVAKHFPGHGDTDKDSHKTLPVIKHDSLRLDSIELYPFKRLIDHGVGGVMIAHLNIPSLIGDPNRPTTLSSNVVTNLLQRNLGFKGLVFTDALNMKGVTNHFKAGEIEFEALKAGNDVLLYPQDVPEAIHYLKKQVRKGNISEQRINKSCRRIIAFKYWTGLDEYTKHPEEKSELISTEKLHADLHKPEYNVLLRRLNEHALTMVENKNSLLPLQRLDTLEIASVSTGISEFPAPFQKHMDLYTNVKHYHFNSEDTSELFNELEKYDLVIAGMLGTNELPYRAYGIQQKEKQFISQLSARTDVALIHFGNPYALADNIDLTALKSILIAYHDNDSIVQETAVEALFGGIPVDGKLPVSINNQFLYGSGMRIPEKSRLKYTLPEAAGVSSSKLQKVDSIVLAAIEDEATPGCQLFVAKDGKVIMNRSYGHHTYLKKNPVQWNNVYDLASITKIVATVPSLMKLYEQGKMDLSDTLGRFLPRLDTTNKRGLVVRDILTHQARLKSWIPFYQTTLEPLYPNKDLIDNEFSEQYPYKIGAHSYIIKNFRYKDNIFSPYPSDTFSVQVAENMYQHRRYKDSVFLRIDRSELLDTKDYQYSDLGYYYFFQVIEKLTGKPLEQHVAENFYNPLGAKNMMFKPGDQIKKKFIVPTENDMIFRKQLLQGYVHDPGTAMLGGVCGHAGVFSNANDLGKMMQMYLNGGSYGGEEYFSDSTLKVFTDSPFKEENGNRRAIGFDKPVTEEDKPGPTFSGISPNSFGHSGFTGTIAWADKKEDLVYIFLSNRIHPDQDNRKLIENDVRTKIQEAIYEAIINGNYDEE